MSRFPLLMVIMLFPLLGASAAAQDDKEAFWSLMPGTGAPPSGHLIVRVPAGQATPEDWEVQWFVSLRTPKGLRLPLGYVDDRGGGGQVSLRLPAGTYGVEVTRPASTSVGTGLFDLEKGKWVPTSHEALPVGKASVHVQANQAHLVDISYRNPRTASKKQGDVTTRFQTWDSLSLVQSAGGPGDVPTKEPKAYPLLQGASLEALDRSHLVAGLKVKDSRQAAEMALLHVDEPDLQPILAGLVDQSVTLTWPLAKVLVRAREPQSVPALVAMLLASGRPAGQREPAAWALGALGDVRAVEALTVALGDPEPMVRNYAALALGELGARGVVPALVAATRDTMGYVGGRVFFTALETPGIFFLPEGGKIFAIQPIPHYQVRLNAVYALGQLGDPGAVAPLIALLSDRDLQVTREALQGLGNYEGPAIVDALKSQLGGPQAVRFVAIHLLAKRGDASVLDALDALARTDPDALVREAAVTAAARIRKRVQE